MRVMCDFVASTSAPADAADDAGGAAKSRGGKRVPTDYSVYDVVKIKKTFTDFANKLKWESNDMTEVSAAFSKAT